jgi:pimeloyl-ACP methyl ester carboxylesterase
MPRVQVPTFGIWSSGDAYLTEVQMAASGAYVDAEWSYHRLEGASHWFMLDRPDVVSDLFVDYLRR